MSHYVTHTAAEFCFMRYEYIQYYFTISPTLCKHGTIETYGGGSRAPLIRNLGSRCRSEIGYTPLPPYPRGKHPSIPVSAKQDDKFPCARVGL